MIKKVLIYIITIFALGINVISYNNYKIKQIENNKIDLINAIENTDFIKNKNGKYKINKDELVNKGRDITVEKGIPRDNRVSFVFRFGREPIFRTINSLSERNLDEQVYIIARFYLYPHNKEKVNKYIDLVEKNLNENFDDLIKKDNDTLDRLKKEHKRYSNLGYVIIFAGMFVLLVVSLLYIQDETD